MADEFTGFSNEAFDFLDELPSHDKEWLAANRRTYETYVMEPAKAFAAALGERLQEEISPAIVVQPKFNGSISPINRAVRFSADKTPYKDHLMWRFWEGENKKLAPALMVRMSSKSAGFASGAVLDSVDRWRDLIDDDKTGALLAKAIAKLAKGRDLDVAGQELKRVPKPYDEDHPRADLLRHKGFWVRWPEPLPKSAQSPDFVEWCVDRFSATVDVHRWLVDNL